MRPSSYIPEKHVDHDPDDLATAWEFIEDEWDALDRLARRMSRGDRVLQDDLMADVVPVYVPKAVACWNPMKGELRPHIMRSVRMYMWKHSNYRHAPGDSALPEAYCRVSEACKLEVRDELGYILAQLDPYDRSLITMYHLAGLTCEEIGEVLEVTKGTARFHLKRAMEKASVAARRWSELNDA